MKQKINDPHFRVEPIRATLRPQNLCVCAMHNDYSELFIADEPYWLNLNEKASGELLIKRALKFNHHGLLEHPQATLAFGGFPHSVMQQLRTHRTGITFDCASMRYTGKRFVWWYESFEEKGSAEALKEFEKLFYVRPVGEYSDRFGNKIVFDEEKRQKLVQRLAYQVAGLIRTHLIEDKMPFEFFRDTIPAGYRQNFMMSANARTLLHLFNMRLPADAQLEIRAAMEMMLDWYCKWMPEVGAYYVDKYAYKSKLAF